jgi:pimeloyl-ACP methyl ester carboxylesterase
MLRSTSAQKRWNKQPSVRANPTTGCGAIMGQTVQNIEKVQSRDGTSIAYERIGSGPPVILVDGALCRRDFGPARPLAELLRDRYTVFIYDRRGRGESGDTAPYAIEREVEDVAAVLGAAGGSAFVYGISSGAALALEATNAFPNMVKKLALYEAPFIVDDTQPPLANDFLSRLDALVATGQRGAAVKSFMKLVGTPGFAIIMMQLFPVWKKLTSVAHTLPYDIRIVGPLQLGKPLPNNRWTTTVPTLVADGGKSPAWIRNAMKELASVLPNSTHRTLEGQTHMLKPEVLTPVLMEFFRLDL